MATIVFRLAVGCVFILFGRWAYRNPRRLYPNTLYTNPNNRLLAILARAFALLLMLFGSFSILSLATERLTKEFIGAVVALGFSILATWYLRPQVPQVSEIATVPEQTAEFLTVRGKWFVGISIAVATVFTIAVVVFVLLRR